MSHDCLDAGLGAGSRDGSHDGSDPVWSCDLPTVTCFQSSGVTVCDTRANNPVERDEEILWTEFKNAFTRAFTDTTQKQQAYRKLHALRMQGSDLNSYISKFKHLVKKAGYDEATDATIDMFSKRLNRALLDKILDRDTTPVTFDEWAETARKEQQKHTHKTSMMSTTPSKWPTTWNVRS